MGPKSGHSISERKILKEESSKIEFNGSCNLSRRGLHQLRSSNGMWQVGPIHRRYLSQEPETFLSDSRSSHNSFPPSSRARKRTDSSVQTINLGGSSSIIFLVLALLCVLGFILFTQKALVGAISLRNLESNEFKGAVAAAEPSVKCFGEE